MRAKQFSTVAEASAMILSRAPRSGFTLRYAEDPRLCVFRYTNSANIHWATRLPGKDYPILLGNFLSTRLSDAMRRMEHAHENYAAANPPPVPEPTPEPAPERIPELTGLEIPEVPDDSDAAAMPPTIDEIMEAVKAQNAVCFPAMRAYIDQKFEEQRAFLAEQVRETIRELLG